MPKLDGCDLLPLIGDVALLCCDHCGLLSECLNVALKSIMQVSAIDTTSAIPS